MGMALPNLVVGREAVLSRGYRGKDSEDLSIQRPSAAGERAGFRARVSHSRVGVGSSRRRFHQINTLSRPEGDPLACLDIA
jgi:hypothetical protein